MLSPPLSSFPISQIACGIGNNACARPLSLVAKIDSRASLRCGQTESSDPLAQVGDVIHRPPRRASPSRKRTRTQLERETHGRAIVIISDRGGGMEYIISTLQNQKHSTKQSSKPCLSRGGLVIHKHVWNTKSGQKRKLPRIADYRHLWFFQKWEWTSVGTDIFAQRPLP